MIRGGLVIIAFLLALSSVSAASYQVTDGDCSTGTIPDGLADAGDTISDAIRSDPTSYNCVDIVCAVVDHALRPVSVSNGTVDASDGDLLKGNISFVITESNDLSNLRGTCETPAFDPDYCSSRGDWRLWVGFARHYSEDSAADDPDVSAWDNEETRNILGPVPSVTGVETEAVVSKFGAGFTCEDTLEPSLRYRDDFDQRTGERPIYLLFSDNEWDYPLSYDHNDSIHLLMSVGADTTAEEVDPSTLKAGSCAYAIQPRSESVPNENSGWTNVRCTELRDYRSPTPIVLPPGETLQGYTLWMKATDSEGNTALERFELTDYYPANGVDAYGNPEGYCLMENQCLVDPSSEDHENTDFSAYITSASGEYPSCVNVGHGVDDVYCSARGLTYRSEALLDYGVNELAGRNGAVYCGDPGRITGTSLSDEELCAATDDTGFDLSCTRTCILSLDDAPNEWQRSAAIFAANNFPTDPTERLLAVPQVFSEQLVYSEASGIRFVDASDSACTQSGDGSRCTVHMQAGQADGLAGTTQLVYDPRSGIVSLSQTLDLQPATDARIIAGHDVLDEAGLTYLMEGLNTYIDDIRDVSQDPVAPYSNEQLKETARIAAFRSSNDGTMLALVTRGARFTYEPQSGAKQTAPLTVVSVIFQGNFDTDYIDNAKDMIRTNSRGPIRTTVADPLRGAAQGQTYTIYVVAENEQDAHEMVEQLVVRLRPEAP